MVRGILMTHPITFRRNTVFLLHATTSAQFQPHAVFNLHILQWQHLHLLVLIKAVQPLLLDTLVCLTSL